MRPKLDVNIVQKNALLNSLNMKYQTTFFELRNDIFMSLLFTEYIKPVLTLITDCTNVDLTQSQSARGLC